MRCYTRQMSASLDTGSQTISWKMGRYREWLAIVFIN